MSKCAQKAKKAAPHPLPAPDEAEVKAIEAARSSLQRRPPRLSTVVQTSKEGRVVEIGPEHSDRAGWIARLEDAFGTRGQSFAISQLNHILVAVRKEEGGYDTAKANALIAAIEGSRPQNELQAMLALQMVLAHEMAMQATRRALKADQIPQYDSAGNMVIKLMRAFAGHLELMEKLQRGGEQTVRVEHVHVHAGGQAIVGTVAAGGGGNDEFKNQPHAKGELPAPGAVQVPEVWRKDEIRQAVPLSSGGR